MREWQCLQIYEGENRDEEQDDRCYIKHPVQVREKNCSREMVVR